MAQKTPLVDEVYSAGVLRSSVQHPFAHTSYGSATALKAPVALASKELLGAYYNG